jgi:hypothetical protein
LLDNRTSVGWFACDSSDLKIKAARAELISWPEPSRNSSAATWQLQARDAHQRSREFAMIAAIGPARLSRSAAMQSEQNKDGQSQLTHSHTQSRARSW